MSDRGDKPNKFVTAAAARVRAAFSMIRRTAFDTSTEDGRARERLRRVAFSAGAALTAKVATSISTLVLIPIVLDHLGSERFGIWVIISSFLALMAFTDLGIGNGLVTAVAQATGRCDSNELKRLISSAVVALLGVAMLFAIAVGLSYSHLPWAKLIGVRSQEAAAEVPAAIAVFAGCMAVSIPASIAGRVQIGLQQGYAVSVFQILGALASLAGAYVAVMCGGGLPSVVAATVGGPTLASLCNSIMFFGVWRRDLRPGRQHFSGPVLQAVLRSGALFFVLQVSQALGLATDNLVLSRLLGPEFVAQYAIPAKLFGLVSIATGMAINPLWPAYGEAVARGDSAWVRATLLRSMGIVVCAGLVGVAILGALLPTILDLWVGGKVAVPAALAVAFAVWTVIECWGGSVAMYMNGSGVIGIQVVCAAAFAVACLAARIALVEALGVAGLPLGAAGAFLVMVALPYGIFVWLRVRKGE